VGNGTESVSYTRNSSRCFRWAVVIFLVGVVFGTLLERKIFWHSEDVGASRQVRSIGEFALTNPLLECEVAEGTINAPKINFKNELLDMASSIEEKKLVNKMAIYFRDLNNGPVFGLNETEPFIPASLLKVPVMMSYFSYFEEDPTVFTKEITHTKAYEGPQGAIQKIAPDDEIKEGATYSTEELIERMIMYSDNQAVTRLIENIPPKYIRDLYRILGVDDAVLNGPSGSLSVRQYSSFFRILYNASYLSHKNSEKALQMLTKTRFDQGIVAGVPKGTVVAHKFGESGEEEEHQIHDCGIVYYPKHPYLLCMMTRGDEIAKLELAIAEISKFVYDKIDEQYSENAR
jgi:beta-lactamase class A